jgi:hypothetical protein
LFIQAQKTCFSTLKRLVEIWGGKDGPAEFVEFVYKQVVPACFLAPLRDTFDLNDAQATMALSESALCLRAVLEKRVNQIDILISTVLFFSPLTTICITGRRGAYYISPNTILAHFKAKRATIARILYGVEI